LTLLHRARLPPRSTLFPYTTLFRSSERVEAEAVVLPAEAERELGQLRVSDLLVSGDHVLPRQPGDAVVRDHRSRADRLLEAARRSEEHTSELQSRGHLVCRLLLEKK